MSTEWEKKHDPEAFIIHVPDKSTLVDCSTLFLTHMYLFPHPLHLPCKSNSCDHRLKRLSSLSCPKAVSVTHVPCTAEVQLTCPQKTSHDEESSVSSGNLLQSFHSLIVTKVLPMSSLNTPCSNWSSNTFLSYPPRVMEKSLSMALFSYS